MNTRREDSALCLDCQRAVVESAKAALSVLADERAGQSERNVAGDVLSEAARTLRLPARPKRQGQ